MKNSILLMLIAINLLSCKDKQVAQLPPQNITVVKVIKQDVPIYNEMVGQVYGLKDIPIRARVDGFLEEISFEEGTAVSKGQLLYSIDQQPFLAEVAAQKSKLAEAQTLLINAKNELDRYKPLAEMNAVSKSDLDAAQANYDAAIASVDAAKANLRSAEINLGYCTIKAPINGIIGKTEAREGEYVGRDPNPVILNTVSRVDTMRVQFSISEAKYLELARAYRTHRSEEDVKKVVDSNKVDANVGLILSDGSMYEHKGWIDFVNSQIDANTGSLLVQASFPNPEKLLRPGMYSKVKIQLTKVDGAMLVPRRCLMELQGQFSVYAVDNENKIVAKSIVLGPSVGDMVLVKEGLDPNDKIVIDALQKVSIGSEIVPEEIEFESKTQH